ncbi:UNVERIFIED_CONTAM: hypothetical protein FKN15_062286 [Acipenser sinensis]
MNPAPKDELPDLETAHSKGEFVYQTPSSVLKDEETGQGSDYKDTDSSSVREAGNESETGKVEIPAGDSSKINRSCPHCGSRFSRQRDLAKHMKKTHLEEIVKILKTRSVHTTGLPLPNGRGSEIPPADVPATSESAVEPGTCRVAETKHDAGMGERSDRDADSTDEKSSTTGKEKNNNEEMAATTCDYPESRQSLNLKTKEVLHSRETLYAFGSGSL